MSTESSSTPLTEAEPPRDTSIRWPCCPQCGVLSQWIDIDGGVAEECDTCEARWAPNTAAAKQCAEAKVERLERLVEAIAARCRLPHFEKARTPDLIKAHRAG